MINKAAIEDLDKLNPAPNQTFFELYRDVIEKQIEQCPAVTLVDGEDIIGIGGVYFDINEKLGEFWLVKGKSFEQRPIAVIKAMKAFISMIQALYGEYTMQVAVDENNYVAMRMADFLGFKKCGTVVHKNNKKHWICRL